MMKQFLLSTLCFFNIFCFAQDKVSLDFSAASATINWIETGCDKSKIEEVTNYPGNKLAEQILSYNSNDSLSLSKALIVFESADTTQKDFFNIRKITESKEFIKELINILHRDCFEDSLYSNVFKYFPKDFESNKRYQIFFVLIGWEWGDAVTTNYKTENSNETVIVVNLEIVNRTYGENSADIVCRLKKVLSHEMFHLMIDDYKQQKYKSNYENSIQEITIFTLFNEGIAHFISDGNTISEYYPINESVRSYEQVAFVKLSDATDTIFNNQIKSEDRFRKLRESTYGSYWDKYVSICGLFMSYHIFQEYDISGLMSCIEKGPQYFILTYHNICEQKPELQKLPEVIVNYARNYS